MIIERKETNRIKDIKKWIMIYGRRKTGKTFLAKQFLDYDEYFFVKRDRNIVSDKDEEMNYDTFINILKRALTDEKIIVIDEFHRLGEDFLDFLHFIDKRGKIILISSTLFLSKKLFGAHSPILGLFAEVPIGLISMEDTIKALKKFKFDKKTLVELAVLLKEPIAIDFFDEDKEPREILAEVLIGSIKAIPALIGEIFLEEERSISAVYEGILRAIANGKVVSGEISSYLFSRTLIKKDDPSLIQQYLINLAEFGIIKKIKEYNKNHFIYKHTSPLARIFYYADEKYNISERKLNDSEIIVLINEIMPKIIEDCIREYLAEKFGLIESVIEAKDFDVDACLLRFKKPEIVAEIKWKDKIRKEDIDKAIVTLSKFDARKLLFVPDKKLVKAEGLEVVDISDFI